MSFITKDYFSTFGSYSDRISQNVWEEVARWKNERYSGSLSSSCGSTSPRIRSSSSCGSSEIETPEPSGSTCTLAQLFEGEWDPSFAAYLQKISSPQTSPQRNPYWISTDDCMIPVNQMPSPANNFSVSNFTIEMVLSIGIKHGFDMADRALTQLLAYIPAHEQASFRNKLLQRAKLLVKKKRQLPLCAFCRNNGEPANSYMSHILKDDMGRVVCPVLRAYSCPRCGACGDNAHTLTYCPIVREEERCRRPRYPSMTSYSVPVPQCDTSYINSFLTAAYRFDNLNN